jgi:hypothetical protein
MTVIGALSSFRRRDEMSPHKRASAIALFCPVADQAIGATRRTRSNQAPAPLMAIAPATRKPTLYRPVQSISAPVSTGATMPARLPIAF